LRYEELTSKVTEKDLNDLIKDVKKGRTEKKDWIK